MYYQPIKISEPLSCVQVRVDVSARNPGKVQAALTENRRGLSELVLEPLLEEQYYEVGLYLRLLLLMLLSYCGQTKVWDSDFSSS